MNPRKTSTSEGDFGRGAEEKAHKPTAYESQDGVVNRSTRLPNHGASSRVSHQTDHQDPMDRSPQRGRGRRPRSPYRQPRERSPYRAPPRDSRSLSTSRSRSYSPSPPPPPRSRGGLNDSLRSPSPTQEPRSRAGEKRQHNNDHYNTQGNSDPRRFKTVYEERTSRGGNGGYGRQDNTAQGHRKARRGGRKHGDQEFPAQDSRDMTRERSRSPFRHDKADRQQECYGKASYTTTPNENSRFEQTRNGNDSNIKQGPPSPEEGKKQAKVENEKDVEMEPKPQLTEDEIIEQRRKKREAIKAKYKSQQPPLLVQALESNMTSAPNTPQHESSGMSDQASPIGSNSPRTPQSPGSPAAIEVSNDEELANRRQSNSPINDDEGPSAADYDPNMDMQEDRPDHKVQAKSANLPAETAAPEPSASKPKKEFDMFAEDEDDDMFAPADITVKATATGEARALDQSLIDNWDYPDGHYRIIIGELLDGRYAVQQQIGKGTFATVVRAKDTKTDKDVAVKIACNNETMYKAGTKEMDMLGMLNQADPEDKKHIIRLIRNFDHKGHMCLVFENLSADLREVLKKFGRNVGLNLKAIRAYAQQMFLALSHLKKCEVLHADLKPDNVLVNHERSRLKICDLGTAAKAQDAEITPYLVSRFYRAPEVILGMPFDYAIDMWSVGCTLFELYTGRILFPGADNNQMLRTIQECRGKFPKRLILRSTLADRHFVGGDPDYIFVSQERDKISGKTAVRQLHFPKTAPGKDIRARLMGNARGMSQVELKELGHFGDLLEKCLQLDPARRISPNDALRHPFIQHAQGGQGSAAARVRPAMAMPPVRMR